jgi:hypothetical protein
MELFVHHRIIILKYAEKLIKREELILISVYSYESNMQVALIGHRSQSFFPPLPASRIGKTSYRLFLPLSHVCLARGVSLAKCY